jgi:ribosomal-protein-alanine N-acetyltransferase
MIVTWTPPTLETDRLWLRPFTVADAEAVFAYASDPAMTTHTLWESHETIDDAVAFVRDYARSRYFEQVPEPLGIFLKSRPDWAVGALGCHWASQPHGTMELGYSLGRAYWGLGITTEAARAVVGHAFAGYAVERVQARVFVENVASARVCEKLGMTHEGTLRHAVYRRGRFWDVRFYAILRHEWERATDAAGT